MMICIKAVLFIFLLARVSFAQEFAAIISQEIEKCQSYITVDSIAFFASKESLRVHLQKEISILEQEYNEKCKTEKYFEKSGYLKYCDSLFGEFHKKGFECAALNKPSYTRTCYNSQGIYIGAEIMINYDCSKLKSFSIKYKKNGIAYDSTFYPDYGDWEVTERPANASIFRHSSGEKTEIFSDDQERIIGHFWISRNKDTIVSERYFWEKGKLSKTIFKGVMRNFIYGTPCDSVIVTPSDDALKEGIDFNPPPMYNKSFGLIPEENDSEYEKFKRAPYSYYAPTELLEKQKRRCEEYKESQRKKGNKK